MDFSEYNSGKYEVVDKVKCLTPSTINVEWSWNDTQINYLLSKASYYLGVLNTIKDFLPSANFFVSGTIMQEAIKSNEIEGTRTELEEVLDSDEHSNPKTDEVRNYMEAAHKAFVTLLDGKSKGLTEELLLSTHAEMLGIKKTKYKTVQNWIGGSSKYDARFTPAPPKEVKRLMKDLFDFLNNDTNDVPDLVKIAIAHYQLETIHPFDDGNGRIGRILIPMYLIHTKMIDFPLFVSSFLADERRNYYDNLDRVRTDNDLNHWVKFFLNAIKESAKKTIKTIEGVHRLMEHGADIIKETYGAKNANAFELLHLIFRLPKIRSKTVVKELGVSAATANSLLKNFEEAGILVEKTGNQRNKVYWFKGYIELITEVNHE